MNGIAQEKSVRLARFVPASALRVLDCACGDGALGAALKRQAGRIVHGIEKDHARAAAARAQLDEVVLGDQYSLDLPWEANTFDAAVCEGLLPCMRDPLPFLKQLLNTMKPGGVFYGTAPNVQFHEHFLMLARGRWTYGGEGALARGHLRFFTAQSLLALMQTAGFTNIKVGILEEDPPGAFPLDETGRVRLEDIEVGPMSPEHHRAFLVREYLVAGAKPA